MKQRDNLPRVPGNLHMRLMGCRLEAGGVSIAGLAAEFSRLMVGGKRRSLSGYRSSGARAFTIIADGTGESMEIAVVPLHMDRDYLKMIHTVS